MGPTNILLQKEDLDHPIHHPIKKTSQDVPSHKHGQPINQLLGVSRCSRQYFYQLEMASPSMLGRPGPNVFEANTTTVEDTYTWLRWQEIDFFAVESRCVFLCSGNFPGDVCWDRFEVEVFFMKLLMVFARCSNHFQMSILKVSMVF